MTREEKVAVVARASEAGFFGDLGRRYQDAPGGTSAELATMSEANRLVEELVGEPGSRDEALDLCWVAFFPKNRGPGLLPSGEPRSYFSMRFRRAT